MHNPNKISEVKQGKKPILHTIEHLFLMNFLIFVRTSESTKVTEKLEDFGSKSETIFWSGVKTRSLK